MSKIQLSNECNIYQNEDFKTIQIRLLFPFEEKEEYLVYYQLLPTLLCYMDNKYPTEDLFQKERKKNYILGCGCHKSVIGSTGCFTFYLIVPDTKSLGKNILEKQIQFFQEMIYHPVLENGAFQKFEFDREVQNLKKTIKSVFQNMIPYQSLRLREIIDDNGVLSRDFCRKEKELDEITPKKLYDFYQNIILNNQPILYVMGNVKDTNIKEYCEKHLFLKKYKKKEMEGNFYYFLKPKDQVTEINEKSIFKDSSFSIIYKIKDMKKEDGVLLMIVKDLLSSLSSRLLGKKLRDEFDLIYSSRVVAYTHFGLFEITAFIHKEHKEEVKEKILEVMEDLNHKEIVVPLLENIKERKRIDLLRKLDDKYYLFDEYIVKDLDIELTSEEFYELVKKVEFDDIVLFLKRFVLDTIYFLEEGENE